MPAANYSGNYVHQMIEHLEILNFILIGGHPNVLLLEYSRVRSVKTQLIYYQIASMTTCFDPESSSGQS